MLKFPQIRKGRGGGAGGAQAWGKGPGESWAAWGGLGSFWGGPVAAGGGSWARLGIVLGRPGVVLGPLRAVLVAPTLPFFQKTKI